MAVVRSPAFSAESITLRQRSTWNRRASTVCCIIPRALGASALSVSDAFSMAAASVGSGLPPSWRMRSATSSINVADASYCFSKNSCSPKNCGPVTFQ
jgi:hypothetical protein